MSLAALFLWVGLLHEKGEQEENDDHPDPQDKKARAWMERNAWRRVSMREPCTMPRRCGRQVRVKVAHRLEWRRTRKAQSRQTTKFENMKMMASMMIATMTFNIFVAMVMIATMMSIAAGVAATGIAAAAVAAAGNAAAGIAACIAAALQCTLKQRQQTLQQKQQQALQQAMQQALQQALQQKKQEHASADIAAAAAPSAEALAGIAAVADDLADEGTVPVGDDSVDAHFGSFGHGESVRWKEVAGHEGGVGTGGFAASDQNEIVKGGKYWYWDRKDGQEKQVLCVVLPHVRGLTQGRIPLSKCAKHATGGSGLDRPRLGPALVWNSS